MLKRFLATLTVQFPVEVEHDGDAYSAAMDLAVQMSAAELSDTLNLDVEEDVFVTPDHPPQGYYH